MTINSVRRNNRFSFLAIAIFLLCIEGISLFRDYPLNPECGKVVQVVSPMRVLVNCDSAVFLKDADDPSRIFNGETDYVDRPLFSLAARALKSMADVFQVPDLRREITGNSGQPYSYSLLLFGIFVFLNFIILYSAALIVKIATSNKLKMDNSLSRFEFLILINALILVFANELTKTFFWTPHSQIFNVLVPAFAVWIIQFEEEIKVRKRFYFLCATLGLLLFAYPAFGLLLILLLFIKFSSARARLFVIGISVTPYLIYPTIVRFFGGEYENPAVVKFREFIWVFDGINGRSSPTIYLEKISGLFDSIPIFPTLLIVAAGIYIKSRDSNFLISRENQLFIGFFIFYFAYVFGMGLGERRVTLAPFLFACIYLLTYFNKNSHVYDSKVMRNILVLLVFIQIGSWVFTLGPLV